MQSPLASLRKIILFAPSHFECVVYGIHVQSQVKRSKRYTTTVEKGIYQDSTPSDKLQHMAHQISHTRES